MKKNPIIKQALAVLALTTMLATNGPAQLLFTQYYEGTGTNKYYEIKNLGSTSIDLTLYTVSLYTNANTEAWKTGSTTGASNFALTGSLVAGGILLVGNSGNTAPSYALSLSTNNNTTANFNGNDSLVLWNDSAAFSTTQIVDAISFTNAGNEGVDKSFVRVTTAAGYNLTAGSNILGFSSVWNQVTLADVAGATAGTNNYLGASTLTSVPEPQTWGMIGIGMVAALAFARRRFVQTA